MASSAQQCLYQNWVSFEWECHCYLLAQPQCHSWKQMESLNLNAIILTKAVCEEISKDHILGFQGPNDFLECSDKSSKYKTP